MMLQMTSLLLVILTCRWVPGGATIATEDEEYTNIGLNGKMFTDNITFESTAASVLGCAVQCSRKDSCVTFTFHQKTCRGYDVAMSSSSASSPASGARSFGRKSEEITRDVTCTASGAKRVTDPSLGLDADAYCDGNWLVFQKRQDGSVDFYRNWSSYVNGFGDVHREFWMGLEPLHLITTSGVNYELRVDLTKRDGTSASASFSNFYVESAAENYKLHYDNFLGDATAGNSLSQHNGMEFSTWDADHDTDVSTNCAEQKHGAWWYYDCHNSNLNGDYSTTGAYDHRGMVWSTFGGYLDSLKSCQMKIKPTLD